MIIIEKEVYSAPTVKRITINTIHDWRNIEFESSSGKTEEFMTFCRMYRAHIKKICAANGLVITSWSNGHFDCFAFITNTITGKIAYMSCSDVRYFPKSWHSDILVRTADYVKDYTGGANHSATLETLGEVLIELTK